MEYSSQLEAQSAELSRTARKLREANDKLRKLSVQKDAFLSQISHELRTPMTSIRAFSEIMMDAAKLSSDEQAHFAQIIHDESIRLTRLLDDLLDLSVLEHGQVQLDITSVNLRKLIDQAVTSSKSVQADRQFRYLRVRDDEEVLVTTDAGRLTQVFINILSNARKYCHNDSPEMHIQVRRTQDMLEIDFTDNGAGIPTASQALIFEKFARLTDSLQAGGAGLGLAICREIMQNLGGDIIYVPGQGGASFRVSFPKVLTPRLAPARGFAVDRHPSIRSTISVMSRLHVGLSRMRRSSACDQALARAVIARPCFEHRGHARGGLRVDRVQPDQPVRHQRVTRPVGAVEPGRMRAQRADHGAETVGVLPVEMPGCAVSALRTFRGACRARRGGSARRTTCP